MSKPKRKKPKFLVIHQAGDWDTAETLAEAVEKAKTWPEYDIRDNEELLVVEILKRVTHGNRAIEVKDEA